MRRRLLVVLLALGTVGGYSSGIASMRYRSKCHRGWTEARTAQTCPPCPAQAEAPGPSGPR